MKRSTFVIKSPPWERVPHTKQIGLLRDYHVVYEAGHMIGVKHGVHRVLMQIEDKLPAKPRRDKVGRYCRRIGKYYLPIILRLICF